MIRRLQSWLARTAARYERLHLQHAPEIQWPEGRQFLPEAPAEHALIAASRNDRVSSRRHTRNLDTVQEVDLVVIDRGAIVPAGPAGEAAESGGERTLQAPLCLADGAGRVFLAAWTRADLALQMQPADAARGQLMALPAENLLAALDPPLGLVVNPGWQGSLRWEHRDLARWLARRASP